MVDTSSRLCHGCRVVTQLCTFLQLKHNCVPQQSPASVSWSPPGTDSPGKLSPLWVRREGALVAFWLCSLSTSKLKACERGATAASVLGRADRSTSLRLLLWVAFLGTTQTHSAWPRPGLHIPLSSLGLVVWAGREVRLVMCAGVMGFREPLGL